MNAAAKADLPFRGAPEKKIPASKRASGRILVIVGVILFLIGATLALFEYRPARQSDHALLVLDLTNSHYTAPFVTDVLRFGEDHLENRIRVSAPLDNSWMDVAVAALDGNGQEVTALALKMSHYHGSIEGRPWQTGSKAQTNELVLPTAGNYRFRITVRAAAGTSSEHDPTRIAEPLHLELRHGGKFAVHLRMLGCLLLCFLGAALVLRGAERSVKAGSSPCAIGDPRPAANISPPIEGHLPQLDGLRALAVLVVLNHHFLNPELQFPLRPLMDRMGNFSVRLFFVLSGFLITGILLRCRREANAAAPSLGRSLGQFYIRRCLRIFPLYYAVLAAAAVLDLPEVRDQLAWHAAYLSNVHYVLKGSWGDGASGHFWSLAVEEQFYLLWPPLILALPRRWLLRAVIGAIVAGQMFRVIAVSSGWNMQSWYFLAPACFDSLGAGALLAYACSPTFGSLPMRQLLERIGLWVGLPACVILLLLINTYGAGYHVWVLLDIFMAAFFIWLVSRAGTGFRGVVGTVLAKGPLAFIGRISYGVYVYHFFVFWMLIPLVPRWFPTHPNLALYLISTLATLVVATVSFKLFENPINALKRFFPYTTAANGPTGSANGRPAKGDQSPG